MDVSETTDALLEDSGDLAPGDEFTPEPEPDGDGTLEFPGAAGEERQTHRAVCMVAGCTVGVTYRPTLFGGGFTVLERVDVAGDASIGIGPNGRPVCPVDGHGEMTLADEQLPAAEAFAQVAEKLESPVQRALPGVFPTFNYAGAFNEIVAQAKLVERLNDEYDDAKREASEAKKNLDKGAELLMRMTLQFEQRRREKPEPDGPSLAAPRVITCVWDQQHPDDACPLCADTEKGAEDLAAIERFLGHEIAPKHANAHIDHVVEYRAKADVQNTIDAIEGVLHDVSLETVTAWTPEQRAAVREWAAAVGAAPDVVSEPAFPEDLGRPHRAAVVGHDEQAQRCVACSQTIKTFDDQAEAYEPLALVRLDCAGEERDEHRYPERKAKAKRARKVAEPKPAKAAKKPAKKKGGR